MKSDKPDDIDQPSGSILFGGVNTNDCSSIYTIVPLQSEAVWWFHVDASQVSGQPKTLGPFVVGFSIKLQGYSKLQFSKTSI